MLDVMLNESDVVIALPGGVGTLDEVFHVMAAATLDYQSFNGNNHGD